MVCVPVPDSPVRPNPRRPHSLKTLDTIRQLYQATAFFRAVPARTGVSAATVSHQNVQIADGKHGQSRWRDTRK